MRQRKRGAIRKSEHHHSLDGNEMLGKVIMSSVFGVFVLVMWILVQTIDFNDCVSFGMGC